MNILNKITQHKATVLVTCFFVLAFWYISSHGFVTIQLPSEPQGEVEIIITNSSGDETKHTTTEKTKRVFLTNGDKQILVRSADGANEWAFVQTQGFLRNTTHNVESKYEAEREFVGQNPSSCSVYTDTVLISYDCNGSIDSIKVHVPATKSLPSYVSALQNPTLGIIENIFVSRGKVYVLGLIGHDPAYQAMFEIKTGKSPSLGNEVIVAKLPADEQYYTDWSGDSFVLHNRSYSQAFLFSAPNTIDGINLTEPEQDVIPKSASTSESSFVRVYTNTQGPDVHDPTVGRSRDSRDTVYIDQNDKHTKIDLKEPIVSANSCGEGKICVVWAGGAVQNNLTVYKIVDGAPEDMYTVRNIESLVTSGNKTLLVLNNGVVELDVERGRGSLLYSFGDYDYCGVRVDLSGVNLCVRHDNTANMLRLHGGRDAKPDDIDKKLFPLYSSEVIEAMNVYKDFIFVTPKLETVFVDGGYGYDPEQKAIADQKINQLIRNSGINTSKYTVVNLRR